MSTGWGGDGLLKLLKGNTSGCYQVLLPTLLLPGYQVLAKLAGESGATRHPSVYVCVYMCGALAGKYLAALLVVLGLSKCSGKGMLAGQWQEVATSPEVAT